MTDFRRYMQHPSLKNLAARLPFLGGTSSNVTSANFHATVASLFNAAHYSDQHPEARSMTDSEKLSHYFQQGVGLGHSPVADFDERFYLAFYRDVREAVDAGALSSGFEHYLRYGKAENRLPRHDLKKAIEERHHGLADPIGFRRADELEAKIAPPHITNRPDSNRIIHIVVPDLNPDVEFAGYRSLIEIILEMRRRGKQLNFIKTFNGTRGIDYFLYHYRDKPEIIDLLKDVTAVPVSAQLEIGRNDRVLAYSCWDCYAAWPIVQSTSQQRYSFLIQEYEPIFYDNNSFRFMCDQTYRFPHFPIFNSELLKTYFQENRLGVFHATHDGGDNYHVFEHHFAPPAQLNVEARPQKNFFLYARPEAHAGRNLFEVSIVALRRFLAENKIPRNWTFTGLGAFNEYHEIRLSDDHIIQIKNRLPFEQYAEFIETVDVGMSLMYAPHPSVLPFELLARGAVVVTNKFENRDQAKLSKFGKNLIVADTTLDGIVSSLRTAFEMAGDYDGRIANAYRPEPNQWSTIASKIVNKLEKEDLA